MVEANLPSEYRALAQTVVKHDTPFVDERRRRYIRHPEWNSLEEPIAPVMGERY